MLQNIQVSTGGVFLLRIMLLFTAAGRAALLFWPHLFRSHLSSVLGSLVTFTAKKPNAVAQGVKPSASDEERSSVFWGFFYGKREENRGKGRDRAIFTPASLSQSHSRLLQPLLSSANVHCGLIFHSAR